MFGNLFVFFAFLGFLMGVEPILGNLLGIVWESVGNPLDVLGLFLGLIHRVFVGISLVLLVVQWDHLGTFWVSSGF